MNNYLSCIAYIGGIKGITKMSLENSDKTFITHLEKFQQWRKQNATFRLKFAWRPIKISFFIGFNTLKNFHFLFSNKYFQKSVWQKKNNKKTSGEYNHLFYIWKKYGLIKHISRAAKTVYSNKINSFERKFINSP